MNRQFCFVFNYQVYDALLRCVCELNAGVCVMDSVCVCVMYTILKTIFVAV